jgi:RNA polymerase sigma-70 factor (ECF subfamily)
MEEQELNHRLSRITTMWTVVFQAHQGQDTQVVTAAQRVLMQRYCGAVYRYLLAAVRDTHVADELSQEFALAFIRGDFRRVDPERGRFRDYVKTVLFNLVNSYRKKSQRQPRGLPEDFPEPAAPEELVSSPSDEDFIKRWREELLARAWEALAKLQETTGQIYHTVLRYRSKHPEVQSAQMAEQLGAQLGRPLTAAGVRQTLHRARDKFADFLLDEVAYSLETTDLEKIEQELVDLELLSYCQDALKRRAARS